ncbi:MAG: ABC transporter substrate binding protein [Candidatus Electrothrix sp. Rat3]|nr:ABC transporter substrate binding protein [Candidatus Electrothrix rattekaaiensis]
MNKYLVVIIILFLSLADRSFGYEIVVLKSRTSKVNQHIQKIFTGEFNQRTLQRGLKSIQPNQMTEVVISRGNEGGSARKIQSIDPDLILALGAQALEEALLVPDIPVVHLLVVHPETIIDKSKPVIGVSLSVPPKVQLDEMNRYFPEVKRIGLVYNPKQSQKIIEKLKSLRPDLKFIALATEDIAAVPDLIHSLRGKVDLLWMLPDLTTTNQMTIQSYVLFSIRNKIPLLTFSKKLFKYGATIAVTFDIDDMAKQAAVLAMDMLLHPVRSEQVALVAPRLRILINRKMAAKLGISIEDGGEADE